MEYLDGQARHPRTRDSRRRRLDGAEIKQCCHLADVLELPLVEVAAKFIVPVSKSSSEIIERLRKDASGRFLSASKPGPYHYETHEGNGRATAGRRIDMGLN